LFSFIFGILSLGASRYVSSEVIEFALLSTLGIFVSMTIVGFLFASFNIDLSFMLFILFCALLGLVVVRLVLLFTNTSDYVNEYAAYIFNNTF
jgi:FtsH-binding integral membrane protein